jgi:predicted  nucleic acid-binding Zn-ribbon protein
MDVTALLELQRLDTALDQAKGALDRLAERERHAEAVSALVQLRARRDDIRRQQMTQESELALIEKKSAEIDAHRARLDKQMKTIIAPREAEALQHELETLALQRSELDDRGLLLLESSSEADRDIERLVGEEIEAVNAEDSARQALEAAVAVAEAALMELHQQREEMAASLVADDALRSPQLPSPHFHSVHQPGIVIPSAAGL